MKPRILWSFFAIFAVTIIALSVLLPLYFLKWKTSTSKGLAAGSGPLIVSEIQVPWFYPYFFTNMTDTNDTTMIQFATDVNGQVCIIDTNGYMISINGSISRSSIKQITIPSNISTFFSKNSSGVALATVSELQARIQALKNIDLLLPVTSTASNGSFCLSDDRTRLSPRSHIEKHLDNKLVYSLIIADAECQRMINEYAKDVMLAYKEIIMSNASRRCIDLDTFVTIRFHDKLFLHKLLSVIKPKMNEELNNALKMFKTL